MSSTTTTPAAGDASAAAAALAGRHGQALRDYLRHLPGADAAAKEAVARDVLAEAVASGGVEFAEDPAVWLFTRGRRRIPGAARGESLTGGAGGGVVEEEVIEGEDPRVAVHAAFGRLTAKQQEALRLRFQFGFGIEELARITGLSRAAATSLLHHAVQRIGQALGGWPAGSARLAGEPRLTAYALDELDPAERRALEQSVGDGRSLLEMVELTRGWAAQIGRVLEAGAPMPRRRRRRRGRSGWKLAVLGSAVALLVAAGLAWLSAGPQTDGGASSGAAGAPGIAAGGDRGGVEQARGGPVTDRRGASRPAGSGIGFERIASVNPRTPGGPGGAHPSGGAGVGAGGPGGGPTFGGFGTGGAASGGGTSAKAASVQSEAAIGEQRLAASAEPSVAASDPMPPHNGFGPVAVAAAPEPATGAPAAHPARTTSTRAGDMASSPGAEVTTVEATRGEAGDLHEAVVVAATPTQAETMDVAEMKRRLERKQWPAAAAVDLTALVPEGGDGSPLPAAEEPVRASVEAARSPWDARKRLVRVVLRAREAPPAVRPRANLVFAIDVSESMAGANRLPLVREAVRRLAGRLRPDDRVAVVTYAESASVALPALPAARLAELRACLAALEPAGLTNGAGGLLEAYRVAREGWIEGGLNAVVLCTDGNFNLGTDSEPALLERAAVEAAGGLRLSVFGFGRSDRNDLRLELLAARGGGRSCYVNTSEEAERLLVEQVDGLFEPVAESVRLQVEPGAGQTAGWRRIDVAGDADTGAPDLVTADLLLPGGRVGALFEFEARGGIAGTDSPVAVVQFDYRESATGLDRSGRTAVGDRPAAVEQGSAEFRFAVALAEFGRILRAGPAAASELDRLQAWARDNLPEAGGYRAELLELCALARAVAGVAVEDEQAVATPAVPGQRAASRGRGR